MVQAGRCSYTFYLPDSPTCDYKQESQYIINPFKLTAKTPIKQYKIIPSTKQNQRQDSLKRHIRITAAQQMEEEQNS